MTSEALNQVIELIKQWSEQASLSTDNFDLQAVRSAMTTTQIPAPESIEIEKVNIGGISAEWILGPGAQHDQRLLYLHGGFYVAGTLEFFHPLSGRISIASGCSVLLSNKLL